MFNFPLIGLPVDFMKLQCGLYISIVLIEKTDRYSQNFVCAVGYVRAF